MWPRKQPTPSAEGFVIVRVLAEEDDPSADTICIRKLLDPLDTDRVTEADPTPPETAVID